MTKFKIVIVPISLLFCIMTTLMFIKFKIDWKQNFEQYYLDTVVNYCTDAAMQEMLDESSDIQTDYMEYEYVQVNPQVALDTFCEMFCENLGYNVNAENIALIQGSYLKGFAVVTQDGLYIAEPEIMADKSYEFIFRPKKAFRYGDYNLSLNSTNATYWSDTSFSIQVKKDILPLYSVQSIINAIITDEFMGSIYRNTEGSISSAFYVPAELTDITNANPIDNITVLAYVKGVQLNSINPIDSFAIGGSKIEHEEFVAAYMRDGVKYYIEVSKLNGTEEVITIYPNSMEAAEDGYTYDLSYFE